MSSPTTDYKFQGWLGHDAMSNKGNLIWGDFEPKAWEETDIDIKITHSGICGSDLHTLRSGWGPTDYPVCVGHEIVGFAVRVGSKVESGIKIGDRVGVGAQSDSCLGRLREKCDACLTDQEQYCPHAFVATYASKHLNGDKSYGGYATYNRSPSHFVFKIPDALPSEAAAPMLCAGITTYSPLRHYGAGPGKSVGVVGLGGLGHFAVLWARALGADSVVAISRKASKRQEALALGADSYIATSDAADWVSENRRSLDIVISTLSSSQVPMKDYLSLLRRDGVFIQVGNPDDGVFAVPAPSLIMGRVKLTGSLIGSPHEIRQMLQFAADKRVQPLIQTRLMREANQALIDMEEGNARYRYVLLNE